jgi:hypothetical protein
MPLWLTQESGSRQVSEVNEVLNETVEKRFLRYTACVA